MSYVEQNLIYMCVCVCIFISVVFFLLLLCCPPFASLSSAAYLQYRYELLMLHLYLDLNLRKLNISMNLNIHYLPSDEVVSPDIFFASSVQRNNICNNIMQQEPKPTAMSARNGVVSNYNNIIIIT